MRSGELHESSRRDAHCTYSVRTFVHTENAPVLHDARAGIICTEENVLKRIVQQRGCEFDNPLWKDVPAVYKQVMYTMLSGGIKASSHGKYMQNYLEFWRTMRRLGISDELVFAFPIEDTILQIYIINCCIIRKRKNVYGTIRGKLRAIDYIAQLAGKKQSWSENPALFAMIAHVKKRNPNKGSDTLPITASVLVQVIEYIMATKVYADLQLSADKASKARRWLSFDDIWLCSEKLRWYVYAISVLTLGVLGLRGAECYENSDKQYEGYGLYVGDVTTFWRNPHTKTVYESNEYSEAVEHIHHVRFELRNSKTACVGSSVFLRMGRTHRRIDPAILVYHVQQLQLRRLNDAKSKSRQHFYLFAVPGHDFTLRAIKVIWKQLFVTMQFLEAERYRLHGSRKGFATTLLQNGAAMSLIAFAGMWKLHAAIYRYLIHTQEDLLQIAFLYLYGSRKSTKVIDLDESEYGIVRDLHKNQHVISKEFFRNTQNLRTRDM